MPISTAISAITTMAIRILFDANIEPPSNSSSTCSLFSSIARLPRGVEIAPSPIGNAGFREGEAIMPIATKAINRSAKPFGASRVPSSGEQLGDQPGRGAAGKGRGILDPVHLEREGGGALLVRAPRLGSRGAAGGAQLLQDRKSTRPNSSH